MEPISLRASRAACTFPNSLPKLFVRSWALARDTWLTPDSVTHIVFEGRLCLLLCWTPPGPLLGSFWSVLPFLGWLGPPL